MGPERLVATRETQVRTKVRKEATVRVRPGLITRKKHRLIRPTRTPESTHEGLVPPGDGEDWVLNITDRNPVAATPVGLVLER